MPLPLGPPDESYRLCPHKVSTSSVEPGAQRFSQASRPEWAGGGQLEGTARLSLSQCPRSHRAEAALSLLGRWCLPHVATAALAALGFTVGR